MNKTITDKDGHRALARRMASVPGVLWAESEGGMIRVRWTDGEIWTAFPKDVRTLLEQRERMAA